MKKILWIILALIFVMTGFACSAPAISVDMFRPWNGVFEKATYEVSYYYYLENDQPQNSALEIIKDPLDDNKPKIKIASGTMDYIIEQADPENNTWKLSTNLAITYVPETDLSEEVLGEPEYTAFTNAKNQIGLEKLGKEDKMNSSVVFDMNAGKLFRPISVTKSFENLEYSFDYTARKFTYKLKDAEEQSKSYKAKEVKSGYDNEQLFLYVRALDKNSYGPGASMTISPVYNWTDAVGLKNPASYKINMSIDKEWKTIPVSESFLPYVQDKGMLTDDRLSVYEVTLSKASTNEAGTPLKVWYSKMNIDTNNIFADKLMIKAVQNTMDVSTVRKIFSVSYDIASLEIN